MICGCDSFLIKNYEVFSRHKCHIIGRSEDCCMCDVQVIQVVLNFHLNWQLLLGN